MSVLLAENFGLLCAEIGWSCWLFRISHSRHLYSSEGDVSI